jgi:ATP-dependent Clp protease adaptor protein ClpS
MPWPGQMRYAVTMASGQNQTGDNVKERERVDTKKQDPTLYKVVLLNDDYTPMQLVVDLLEAVFQKSPAEAYRVMMQVHQNGRGVAGIYPWEVAETKAAKVAALAREAGYPLRATIEDA